MFEKKKCAQSIPSRALILLYHMNIHQERSLKCWTGSVLKVYPSDTQPKGKVDINISLTWVK